MNWIPEDLGYYSSHYMDGMLRMHPDRWEKLMADAGSAALMRKGFDHSRWATVIVGGGAHGPLFPGFVWDGLADAAIVGGPFSAPNAYMVYEACKALAGDKGVLLLYNNFMGDYLNCDMATELLGLEHIAIENVIATDDIATAPREQREERSGRTGIIWLMKLSAACANRGMALEETADLLKGAQERLGTLSMHVDLEARAAEYGRGFSGEPGFEKRETPTMAEAVERALELLCADIPPKAGEKACLLINRMHNTSYFDSCFMADIAGRWLDRQGGCACLRAGDYLTNIDVYGCDFTLLWADAQLRQLLDTTVHTDSFTI